MTLNGMMAVIMRYFSEFAYLPGVLRKSSRSLSHLLMSSCNCILVVLNTNRTRTVNDRQSELETTAYSTNNHAILISSPTQFAAHGLIDLLTLESIARSGTA